MTLKPEDDMKEAAALEEEAEVLEQSDLANMTAEQLEDAEVLETTDLPDSSELTDPSELLDPLDAPDPSETSEEPEESEAPDDDSTAAVTFDGDRPVVRELEYQAPKPGKPVDEEEGANARFSSVAEAKAVVEGFLFSCNEPLTVPKLSKLMGNLHPKTVRGLLLELQWDYENHHGALQVIEIAGGYQLCTRAFVAPWMFRMHKHKRRSALSPATLETLAIIAYRQPITRGEIEGIRGVESGAPVRTLQDLNLVEASGRREVVGRPQLYVTTEQFLRTFGLKSVGDLPSISELKTRFAEEQKLKPVVASEPVVEAGVEELEQTDELENIDESSQVDTPEISDELNAQNDPEELEELDQSDESEQPELSGEPEVLIPTEDEHPSSQ